MSNVDKKTADGELPVRLCNYTDVYHNGQIDADMSFMRASATLEQVRTFGLCVNDILITKDSETPDDIGAVSYVASRSDDMVCGYHLAIIRPDLRRVEARFLYWSLVSKYVREQLAVAATGVTRFGLRAQSISNITLPLPAIRTQKAVVAFLDSEIARIDTLISKKRTLTGLLEERKLSLVDKAVGGPADRIPLRRVASRITSGPRGWAAYVSDTGSLFLRIANVQRDHIELSLTNSLYVSAPDNAEARRVRVRAGDVLVTITADIGSVAITRAEHEGAFVSQHIALITPKGCHPRWLAYSLRGSIAQGWLDAARYGGTKVQLALEDIAGTPVWIPEMDEQMERLRALEYQLDRLDRANAGLRRQIALLQEYRQALITAAVIGEIEAPGVSK